MNSIYEVGISELPDVISTQSIPGFRKPKFVIFEGPDKSGKSTLFREFRAATRYIPLAIDRFTGSNYVYDIYYKRGTDIDMYLKAEEELQDIFDCYLVLLDSDPKVLEDRIIREEGILSRSIALDNYLGIRSLFNDYFINKTNYKKKILIETDLLTVKGSLDMIMKFTGEEYYG